MLSNVRRSASRSPWLSRGANPAAIISNSGEFLSGGNVANTPITASSVIIAAPSSPCRICAPAWSNSARTRAATAAATARPAFPRRESDILRQPREKRRWRTDHPRRTSPRRRLQRELHAGFKYTRARGFGFDPVRDGRARRRARVAQIGEVRLGVILTADALCAQSRQRRARASSELRVETPGSTRTRVGSTTRVPRRRSRRRRPPPPWPLLFVAPYPPPRRDRSRSRGTRRARFRARPWRIGPPPRFRARRGFGL